MNEQRYPLRNSIEEREQASTSTLLAMSLARQGRIAEARAAVGPVVKLQRALSLANHGDQLQKIELAAALHAQALAEPGKRCAAYRGEVAVVVGAGGHAQLAQRDAVARTDRGNFSGTGGRGARVPDVEGQPWQGVSGR